jgi:hypothetical protein
MVTPPVINIVTVASAAVDIAPTALAVAISTLQVAATASREHVVGAIIAAGTPAGTAMGATVVMHHNPPTGPPFLAAGASAPDGRAWTPPSP